MTLYHEKLAGGAWFRLSFFKQMANIGSEVDRALKWKDKNIDYSRIAFYRALELIELTLEDEKNKKYPRLKELARLKEVLIDFFCLDNKFLSSEQFFRKYFFSFAYASQMKK